MTVVARAGNQTEVPDNQGREVETEQGREAVTEPGREILNTEIKIADDINTRKVGPEADQEVETGNCDFLLVCFFCFVFS